MSRSAISVLVVVTTLLVTWLLVSQSDRPGRSDAVTVAGNPSKAEAKPATEARAPAADTKTLTATTVPNPDAPPAVMVFEPPPLDTMLAEAKEAAEVRHTYRFASPIKTDVTPDNAGVWTDMGDGTLRWQFRVKSPGARNLNLGFTEYRMPAGGTLTLSAPETESPWPAFTAADNDDHGQLWTPLLKGEEMEIEVTVPSAKRDDLVLRLASVNHGFLDWGTNGIGSDGKIGNELSAGDCHIDVACNAEESGAPFIEFYRDPIRSVGAYTIGGVETCSGALINTTANDERPYFLTAWHCAGGGFDPAGVVVYWKFENSTCRPPDTLLNGGIGDGELTTFNTGANFLAASTVPDFLLLELDDPVNPNADAFFAGWDRGGGPPTVSVAVHHPSVAEKRISFEFAPGLVTSWGGNVFPGDGSHIRITNWDLGATAPGSSGSPVFDQNLRIIGQLHGGFSSCSVMGADWYGRLAYSWENNGSPGPPATQLEDWLDPLGTGAVVIDGRNQVHISAGDATFVEGSGFEFTNFVQVPIRLSRPAPNPVTVLWTTADSTATVASFDYYMASGSVTFNPGETEKVGFVGVIRDFVPEIHESFIVFLFNNVGAPIQDQFGLGIILNDDYVAPEFVPGNLTGTGTQGEPFSHFVPTTATATDYTLFGAPGGLTIKDGLLSWPTPMGGTFVFDIEASNPAGSARETFTLTITPHPVLNGIDAAPEKFPIWEVPTIPVTADWFTQSAFTHDGVDAARSGNIGDSAESAFEITVEGPGEVRFWWNVSSEEGWDYLYFLIDGALMDFISGESQPWRQVTRTLTSGKHTLRWQYQKDTNTTRGTDSGYVDQISFTGYAGWIYGQDVKGHSGINDNSDGDFLTNFGEYGLGRNPSIPDFLNTPEMDMVGGKLRLIVTKPAGLSGVNYIGQGSRDGTLWDAGDVRLILSNATTLIYEEDFSPPQPESVMLRLLMTPTN